MSMEGLPAYLPLEEVAEHAGVKANLYWRWLRRNDATQLIGHDKLVLSDVLRKVAPSVYERVLTARTLHETDEVPPSGTN